MLYDARTDVYFTGHSLRCSGTSHLFQAGVEWKLTKEMTGHRSGTVDCYAITSDKQHDKLCSFIAEKPKEVDVNEVEKDTKSYR